MPKKTGSIIKNKQAKAAALKATAGTPKKVTKTKVVKVKKPHEMTAAEYQAHYQAVERAKEHTAEAKRQKAKEKAKAAEPGLIQKATGAVKKGVAAVKKTVKVVKGRAAQKKRPKVKVKVKKRVY